MGGKTARTMIHDGKVVWPVDAQFSASDGSALVAFFRALASQYGNVSHVLSASAIGAGSHWGGVGVGAVELNTDKTGMGNPSPLTAIPSFLTGASQAGYLIYDARGITQVNELVMLINAQLLFLADRHAVLVLFAGFQVADQLQLEGLVFE